MRSPNRVLYTVNTRVLVLVGVCPIDTLGCNHVSRFQVKLGQAKNEKLQLLNKAGAEAQIKQAIEKLNKELGGIEKEIPDIERKR